VYVAGDLQATGCRRLAHASNVFDILARGGRRGMEHDVHTPMTTPQSSTRERRALRLFPSIAASESAAKSAGTWETVHKFSSAAAPGGRKARQQIAKMKGIDTPVSGWVMPFILPDS